MNILSARTHPAEEEEGVRSYPKKSDWQVLNTENGQTYYYNQFTKEKSWSKPDILKTEEEKQYSVDWEELTTNDGRTFYYNPKLGKSVWKMPPELKAMREKMQLTLGKKGGSASGGFNDLNFSITINSKLDEGEHASKFDDKQEMHMSREEAKRIFINLLREKGINMSQKWETVNTLLKNEERFNVIKTMKEKRQIYQDFISQAKKEERNEARKKLETAKETFKRMLVESNVLTSDKSFTFIQQLFSADPRWKALDEKDRENLVQDLLDELYEQERDDEKRRRYQYCAKIKELLYSMKDVGAHTTWEQINKQLKNNVAWNLMNDLDRLETFIAFIEKKRTIEEEGKRRHVRQVERKNREGFRELLGECVSGKSLTFKGVWRGWLAMVKEDDRVVCMFKQHGSSPKDLFEEVKDGLVEKHKFIRDDFKKILKNNPDMFQTSMLLSDFRAKLASFEDFKNFENRDSNDFEFYSSYLYEKYKKREEKSIKKFYKFMIRELGSESNPGLRDLEEKIAHNPQSASSFTALGLALRESLFSNYMAKRDSDEGVAEMLGKKGKDGKKKKTKKDKKSKTKKDKSSKTKDDYHPLRGSPP